MVASGAVPELEGEEASRSTDGAGGPRPTGRTRFRMVVTGSYRQRRQRSL